MTKKILTAKDILANKKLIEKKENKNYFSKILNGYIEIADKVNKNSLIEIINETDEGQYERCLKLIYLCCPIFKDETLKDGLEGIKTPYDVIEIVLDNNTKEIIDLSNFILKRFGFLDDEAVEKIKKQ